MKVGHKMKVGNRAFMGANCLTDSVKSQSLSHSTRTIAGNPEMKGRKMGMPLGCGVVWCWTLVVVEGCDDEPQFTNPHLSSSCTL